MDISKRSLLSFTSKKVYFECVNACINFTKNGFWYCSCFKFQGCKRKNYICRLSEMHSETDINGVKKNPIKIIKLHLLFCKDVKLCQEFDKMIDNFWLYNHEYTGRLVNE